MPSPDTLVFSARPILRLNEREDERLSSLLTEMVMVEQEGGLSSLELRLSNSASLASGGAEYAFDAGGGLGFGQELRVGAGDSTQSTEIFRGPVTGFEGVFRHDGPPEFIVLAEDALQKFRCRRRSRTFEDASLAEIVRTIAADHALSPVVDGLDQHFGPQVQLNETDLGFLRRLLDRVDADLQVSGPELQVAPRASVRRGEIPLALGRELTRARVLADLAHQVTGTTVKGWDVSAGASLDASGTEAAPAPGRGRNGSELFRDALGERTEHAHERLSFNQDEADALAASLRRQRARKFLRVDGATSGTPELRVGSHVALTGLGTWFSNTYYVTRVCHRFDLTNGYQTEFEAHGAFLGES